MKYLILAILSLSIAQDVSVDIFYAQTSDATTDVIVKTPEAGFNVSVDYSSNPSEGSSSGSATVNVEGASPTKDELYAEYSTYSTPGYSTASASATDAEGNYVDASQSSTVSDDGNGYVTDYEYVDVRTWDPQTGVYTYDYATVYSKTNTTQNETVTEYITNVSIDDNNYQEETSIYTDNINGEGYGDSEITFWINAQAFIDNLFGGYIMALIVLSVVALVGFMILEKIKQETVKRYNATVRPVEECSNYIRI